MPISSLTTQNTFAEWVSITQDLINTTNQILDGPTFTGNGEIRLTRSGTALNVSNNVRVSGDISLNNISSLRTFLTGVTSNVTSANNLALSAYELAALANTKVDSIPGFSGNILTAGFGGTGRNTLTSGSFLVGNGNSPVNLISTQIIFADTSNLKIGMGTTSPVADLDLNKTSNFDITFRVRNTSTNPTASAKRELSTGTTNSHVIETLLEGDKNMTPSYDFSAGSAVKYAYWNANTFVWRNSAGTEWMRLNDRLGIGTASPAERLHVVGNGILTGSLSVGAISTTGTFTSNQNVSTTRTMTANNLVVSSNISSGNISSTNITASGNISVGNVIVTGEIVSTGQLYGFTRMEVLTSGSSWTIPPGVKKWKVTVVGGGGGGAPLSGAVSSLNGFGGSSGAVCVGFYDAVPGQNSMVYSVGAAGAAGGTGGNSSTTYNSISLSAQGSGYASAPGTASGGVLNINGGIGFSPRTITTTTISGGGLGGSTTTTSTITQIGGVGADTPLGLGSGGSYIPAAGMRLPSGFGAGGAGAAPGFTQTQGGSGAIIVEY